MCVHKDRRMCCGCTECGVPDKPQGHPHAALMMQYAEDAMTHDKPWELWECWYEPHKAIEGASGEFMTLRSNPSWHPRDTYRRKPRTIRINGYDVPEPYSEESVDLENLFYVDTSIARAAGCAQSFKGIEGDSATVITALARARCLLGNGMAHTTREAAELHAKALLSFTQPK